MLIRRPEQVQAQVMSLPGAVGVQMRVMIGRADGAPTFAMRLFEVAPGGQTPFHQHNYEHEVMVLAGAGHAAQGADGADLRPIAPGDVLLIGANEPHQFRNTGAAPLRFACLVPVKFDCGNSCQPTPGT